MSAIVHDLGCSEPCTCGAWDMAVEGESELRAYIDKQLTAAFHRKLVDYGYWCPRCDVPAYPLDDNAEPGEAPGWCPLCGLDPRADGPAQDKLGLVAILRGPLAPGPIEGSVV